MKRTFKIFLAFTALAIALPAGAQTTLSNAQVIEMSQAGLSTDVIISAIKNSGKPLDATPMALVALKKAGVSDSVIRAVIESTGNKISEANMSSPQSASGGFASSSTGSMAGDVLSQGRIIVSDGGTFRDLRLDNYTVRQGLVPWKVVASFGTATSPVRVSSKTPAFYVGLPPQYDPLQKFFLLRLDTNIINHRREVGVNPGPSISKKIIIAWDAKTFNDAEKLAVGTNGYVLTPRQPLQAGEYAIFTENKSFYSFGVD